MTAAPSRFPPLFRQWPVLAALLLAALPVVAAAQNSPAWLMLNTAGDDAVLVTDPSEKNKLEHDGWKVNGAILLFSGAEPGTKALHRMARRGDKGTDRMLSANAAEVAASVQDGFTDEGLLGFVAPSQLKAELIPVYRYRKEKRMLWLLDEFDRPWAEKNGWKVDGAAFWILPAGSR